MIKIPVAEPYIGKKEVDYVTQAVASGWVSSKGGFIVKFEKDFAEYCGVKYGVAASSGTGALHLALAALDIGPGDEVIVPALTYVSTADVVRYVGATPIFVDVDEYHWGLDMTMLAKITPMTRAIMAVHLYGHPCDLGSPVLASIVDQFDIHIIEDAAEAHGAELDGDKVGSLGDVGCFSFYGNKIITTGVGGMCVTNDERLADRIRFLNKQAMVKPYTHTEVGFNYGMTNLQAALGCAQLERLDEFVAKKQQIARWYRRGLRGLERKGKVTLHPNADWATCVYWMYSVLVKAAFGMSRDDLMVALKTEGIETRPFFGVIPYFPHYRDGGRYPIAERLANEGINLPSSVNLKKEQVSYICEVIRGLSK